jgi:hypothetical protein
MPTQRVVPEAWLKAQGPVHRIVIHWTAGSYTPSQLDRIHYHLLIDGDGKCHRGVRPLGAYLPHTRALNTGSVGLALCGMRGAQQSPRKLGDSPLTLLQIERACQAAAEVCFAHELAVTERTVLCHSEVPRVYGVPQRGKWDVDIAPWDSSLSPKGVHELLRRKVAWFLTMMRHPEPEA